MNAPKMNVNQVTVKEVRSFIEHHHYSKSINGCKVSMAFALYDRGEMVGAVLFGPLSTTAGQRMAHGVAEMTSRPARDGQ